MKNLLLVIVFMIGFLALQSKPLYYKAELSGGNGRWWIPFEKGYDSQETNFIENDSNINITVRLSGDGKRKYDEEVIKYFPEYKKKFELIAFEELFKLHQKKIEKNIESGEEYMTFYNEKEKVNYQGKLVWYKNDNLKIIEIYLYPKK